MKIFGILLFVIFFPICVFSYQNYGIIEIHELGYIAGNSMTEDYDYVALFRLKPNADIYRAMSDVESSIANINDTVFKIGVIDNFIIASAQSSNKNFNTKELSVKISRATKFGRLCKIFTYHEWTTSDNVNDVLFENQQLHNLCDN